MSFQDGWGSSESQVYLRGKIAKRAPVAYTPKGTPVVELEIAFSQSGLDKKNIGYVGVLLAGLTYQRLDAVTLGALKVGALVEIEGALWHRKYRNRREEKVNDLRVLASWIQVLTGLKGTTRGTTRRGTNGERS